MDRIALGGKSVYGASVGILMLDARFPRIPGDIGNAETWPFPVLYRVVRDATPDRVVRMAANGLSDAFIDAARELADAGCEGITTTCGFLSLFQAELAAAVRIPVATSSLMQYGMIRNLLPSDRDVGILTVSSATLTARHLAAAGVPEDVVVAGTDETGGEFTRVIIGNEERLDIDAARSDLLAATDVLLNRSNRIGAILLECTNMAPFARDIALHAGLPVYDMYGFVRWFQTGLSPRKFA